MKKIVGKGSRRMTAHSETRRYIMSYTLVFVGQVVSGYRIPVGAKFSAPVQTGPGAHPASCRMGTGSFPGVKSGGGVKLPPHPLLVPWPRKSRAIPLLPLWAIWSVESLSVCTRVHFTFLLYTSLQVF